MLLLAGMFFGLMMDVRVEHVDVVREKTVAWLPIIFSAVMTFACMAAFVVWNRVMRWVMIPLFVASIAIGITGVYLHSHGHLQRVFQTSMRAWTDAEMGHSDGPPLTAPMALAGFGVLGTLICIDRSSSNGL